MDRPVVGPPAVGARAVEIDGRISVYSPSTQDLVSLNDTASDVWRLCDGEHPLDQIVELLARNYGTTADIIGDQVAGAVDDLVSLGLLPELRAR